MSRLAVTQTFYYRQPPSANCKILQVIETEQKHRKKYTFSATTLSFFIIYFHQIYSSYDNLCKCELKLKRNNNQY